MALLDCNGIVVKVGDLVEITSFSPMHGRRVARVDLVLAVLSNPSSPRHHLRTAGVLGINKHAAPKSARIRVISSIG